MNFEKKNKTLQQKETNYFIGQLITIMMFKKAESTFYKHHKGIFINHVDIRTLFSIDPPLRNILLNKAFVIWILD